MTKSEIVIPAGIVHAASLMVLGFSQVLNVPSSRVGGLLTNES